MADRRAPGFVCPLDTHSRLHRNGGGAWEGAACAHCYPEEGGIPNFIPADGEGGGGGEPATHHASVRERAARDAQALIYDLNVPLNILGLREIPMSLRMLGLQEGERVLEVGCGTGRFTKRLAARTDSVAALDHSRKSLEVARAKLSGRPVTWLQGTATHLPFADGAFDAVASCQMLNHLPSAEMRRRAVAEMARVVAPGGRVFLSCYRHSWFTRGQKEGEHPGGIYFFRFTREEFESLAEPGLEIKELRGDLGYLWMARCRKPG